jgi:O-phospho-L-seryl-tRNASec:L-selenocysteinyl-tRNA synthase
MNDAALQLARGLVEPHMIDAAHEAVRSNASLVHSLIAQRRMPAEPWPRPLIVQFLHQLAAMDTNNFAGHAGGGEREGRVYSSLVAERHYYMTHGIGRSGDLTADQPKAAGSSLLAKLNNAMVLDALRTAGLTKTEAAVTLPMATGMSLALVLQAVRQSRPDPAAARYVIWPRIDQKTSLKCIATAGLMPIVVELAPAAVKSARDGAASCCSELTMLSVRPDDVAAAIARIATSDPAGVNAIVCVLSTTSCFAPRVPDDTLAIARVCLANSVPLVVNNAYGLQSRAITKRLDAALALGGVAAFVQSGDKNFLTPVGGAVVAGRKSVVAAVSALYPGRASAAPIVDLFITLLEMGRSGWTKLHRDRVDLHEVFLQRAAAFAEARGEELLQHPGNDISIAMTLRNWRQHSALRGAASEADGASPPVTDATALGAHLFRHRVTGPKVVLSAANNSKTVCGIRFVGYGAHGSVARDGGDAPPLLVLACGVGMTAAELELLFARLEAAYPLLKQA